MVNSAAFGLESAFLYTTDTVYELDTGHRRN